MTLSWDASFTLDIPNIHPDIRYCVSIQFVEDVRDMSKMKCEIEETTFVYDFQSKPNGKYNVTVTPVNIVGEGAASSIQVSWRKSKSVSLNKNYYYYSGIFILCIEQVKLASRIQISSRFWYRYYKYTVRIMTACHRSKSGQNRLMRPFS